MSTSDAARALRAAPAEPIPSRVVRRNGGRGELTLEGHRRTREVLWRPTPIERPAPTPAVGDELLSQTRHQTQELWLTCAAAEAAALAETLDNNGIFEALASLERLVQVLHTLGDQVRVLSTLSPTRFQVGGRSVGHSGGPESPACKQLRAGADAAAAALDRLLARRQMVLLDLLAEPDAAPDLHRLVERFVEWDAAFQSWTVDHFMLARRTIGVDQSGRRRDDAPAAFGSRTTRPLFPDLAGVRMQVRRGWSRDDLPELAS